VRQTAAPGRCTSGRARAPLALRPVLGDGGDIADATTRGPAQVAADIDQRREKEMAMSHTTTTKRELAFRVNDGINVSLFWTKVGDILTLEVYDERGDQFYECEVPRGRALDAFRHPFAYITEFGTAASVHPCAA
jgi:hypothetical protein